MLGFVHTKVNLICKNCTKQKRGVNTLYALKTWYGTHIQTKLTTTITSEIIDTMIRQYVKGLSRDILLTFLRKKNIIINPVLGVLQDLYFISFLIPVVWMRRYMYYFVPPVVSYFYLNAVSRRNETCACCLGCWARLPNERGSVGRYWSFGWPKHPWCHKNTC